MKTEIKSLDNAAVKLASRLSLSKERKKQGRFIVEGEKLISDAVNAGIIFEEIFVDSKKISGYEHLLNKLNYCKLISTSNTIIEKISETKTPQGIIGIAKQKDKNNVKINSKGYYVLLENVSDSGNVGTIIRSANAFGFDGVILISCADVYSGKVVRAATGAVFRTDFLYFDSFEEAHSTLKKDNMKIFASALRRDAKTLDKMKFASGICIAIGNEGSGLSESALKLCDETVFIPIKDECESLNAAAAASILLWEVKKQM